MVERPECPVTKVRHPDVLRVGHCDEDDSVENGDDSQDGFTDQGPVEVRVAEKKCQNGAYQVKDSA